MRTLLLFIFASIVTLESFGQKTIEIELSWGHDMFWGTDSVIELDSLEDVYAFLRNKDGDVMFWTEKEGSKIIIEHDRENLNELELTITGPHILETKILGLSQSDEVKIALSLFQEFSVFISYDPSVPKKSRRKDEKKMKAIRKIALDEPTIVVQGMVLTLYYDDFEHELVAKGSN